jgi:hypothetical protein
MDTVKIRRELKKVSNGDELKKVVFIIVGALEDISNEITDIKSVISQNDNTVNEEEEEDDFQW